LAKEALIDEQIEHQNFEPVKPLLIPYGFEPMIYELSPKSADGHAATALASPRAQVLQDDQLASTSNNNERGTETE
jgi:hypothetical protein